MLSSMLRGSSVALRTVSARSLARPVGVSAMMSPIRLYSSSLNKDEISTRIIDVVKAFDKTTASAQVTNETHFAKDLGLDSLDTVELLVAIEEEFDIEIPDKVADEIKSVGEAVKYIETNPEAN
ncbi:LANO_0G12508g1_1 [Lachancea nothofagi CBS 11611]|uniref:Acyl carrier protein n=1 Tax=Lachancea nothofagi CBS 11611 TaxID=1266666 RepID=A0A1G4KJT6_9SACH|nr:LANO_0G12508g1_1 [Lachancea nothofagi CBS 11611]